VKNPPAFPEVQTVWNECAEEREVASVGGMSLRDYFAAKVASECMRRHSVTRVNGDSIETRTNAVAAAAEAYAIADALLKERDK
jgi:hypothetical protein